MDKLTFENTLKKLKTTPLLLVGTHLDKLTRIIPELKQDTEWMLKSVDKEILERQKK